MEGLTTPNSASRNIPPIALEFYQQHAEWTYNFVYGKAFNTHIERGAIYLLGWNNLLTRLFPSEKEPKRIFSTDEDTRSYIKSAFSNAHIDLLRQHNRDMKYLSQISLDAPLQGDNEGLTYADIIGDSALFTTEVEREVDLVQLTQDVHAAVNTIPNQNERTVALSDLECIGEHQIEHLSKAYVRVLRSRLHKRLSESPDLTSYKDQMD